MPLLRCGAALGAAVAALMPLPSLFVDTGGGATDAQQARDPPSQPQSLLLPPAALALWLALMCVKAAAQAAAFTGAMIRVNVAGRRAGGLGGINGVGQTLASLARGLGPAAAGAGWGLAVWWRQGVQAGGRPAAGGGGLLPTQFAPFLAVAAVAVVIYWWYGKAEAEDPEEGA